MLAAALAAVVLAVPAAADSLPPVGIAAGGTASGWCAAVAGPPLEAGAQATLVFPDRDAPLASLPARVVRRRPTPCQSAFPQLSLEELPAYDLAVEGASPPGLPSVALVVAGPAEWRRAPEGMARADLDGDGIPEEARVCAADEGQHFTLWTIAPGAGPRRRWHGYYDWGALVDPTCRPGEDGR